MQNGVQRVGNDRVANWQERVRVTEELLIACGAYQLRCAEVRNPLGVEFAEEEDAVANPEIVA